MVYLRIQINVFVYIKQPIMNFDKIEGTIQEMIEYWHEVHDELAVNKTAKRTAVKKITSYIKHLQTIQDYKKTLRTTELTTTALQSKI